jgi:hypothetical protein
MEGLLSISYVVTFLLSSCLELPTYGFGYRKYQSSARTIILVTLSNLFTHPIVFFGFMSSHWPYLWAVLGAETFAVLVEGLIAWALIPRISLSRTLGYALLANLFSWQVAPMISWIILDFVR